MGRKEERKTGREEERKKGREEERKEGWKDADSVLSQSPKPVHICRLRLFFGCRQLVLSGGLIAAESALSMVHSDPDLGSREFATCVNDKFQNIPKCPPGHLYSIILMKIHA